MNVNRRIIRLAFTLVCSFLLPMVPAAAQALTSSDSAAVSQPALDTISDVFIGKGSKGPYVLSWKNIEAESEIVILSGRKLTRGQDYAIDCAAGAVVFNDPLPADAIARVTYRRIPGKAEPNGGGLSVFGLSGGVKFSQSSDISSAFAISQADTGTSGQRPGLSDRSAMRFAATTSAGALSFKGSFARSGEQFTSAKEYGFQQARELIDLSASFGKATSPIFASFSYREQEELGGEKKGASQTASEQKVVLNLHGAPKVTLSHVTNDKLQADKTTSGASVDTVQLEQAFGQKTTATATLQRSETASGSSTEDVKAIGLAVQSSAIENVQLQGGATRKDSDQTGGEVGIDLGAKAALSKRLSVNTAYSRLDSDKNGAQSKTAVGLAANPLNWVQLRSSVIWKDSDQLGGETGIDFGIKAAPGKRFSFDATHSSIDSDRNGQQTKTGVKVAASPLDRIDLAADVSRLDAENGGHTAAVIHVAARPIDHMKVEGTYSGKQVVQGDDEMQRAVHLEAQPADFIKLSAGVGDKQIGAQQQTSKEAGVEIAASDRIRLASSIRCFDDGQATTTIRDYSGALKPVRCFELSGAYKNRESNVAQDLDSKSVKLAFDPWQSFKVTGQYAYNPEDKKGNVERLSSAAVGIELKLGILGLTGGYAAKDEYLAGRMSSEKEIGLNLPVFRHGKLATGMKITEAVLEAPQSATTYSIGYTHIIGSRFNLSLSGELTKYEREFMAPEQEYKATAKLGMRF